MLAGVCIMNSALTCKLQNFVLFILHIEESKCTGISLIVTLVALKFCDPTLH